MNETQSSLKHACEQIQNKVCALSASLEGLRVAADLVQMEFSSSHWG